MPTFSIIVPCYNQDKYMAECLESVLSQTYTDWECIIIDDGSIDTTQQVATQFIDKDSRISYYYQSNAGVSAARNTGILKARGTYLLPLDGDDKIGPEYLAMALKIFQAKPDTKLVYCKAQFFGEVNEYWALPEYSYDKFLFQNSIFCAAIFKKADFVQTDGYDPEMKIGYEDWEFLIRFLSANDRVVQLNSIQFFYRQRLQSRNSFTSDAALHQQAIDYIYKKNSQRYFEYIGLEDTFEGFKTFVGRFEKMKKFANSFTHSTFFKIEKEMRRLKNRRK